MFLLLVGYHIQWPTTDIGQLCAKLPSLNLGRFKFMCYKKRQKRDKKDRQSIKKLKYILCYMRCQDSKVLKALIKTGSNALGLLAKKSQQVIIPLKALIYLDKKFAIFSLKGST